MSDIADANIPTLTPPSQKFNLNPQMSAVNLAVMNMQIQRLQASQKPPVVDNTAPVNIQKFIVSPGVTKVAIQFLSNPSNAAYKNTSVFLNNGTGTMELLANSGQGPIIFHSDPGTAPRVRGQLIQQINNDTGITSDIAGQQRPDQL